MRGGCHFLEMFSRKVQSWSRSSELSGIPKEHQAGEPWCSQPLLIQRLRAISAHVIVPLA